MTTSCECSTTELAEHSGTIGPLTRSNDELSFSTERRPERYAGFLVTFLELTARFTHFAVGSDRDRRQTVGWPCRSTLTSAPAPRIAGKIALNAWRGVSAVGAWEAVP